MTKKYVVLRWRAQLGLKCKNCGHFAGETNPTQGEYNTYDSDEFSIHGAYQCGKCGCRHIVLEDKS